LADALAELARAPLWAQATIAVVVLMAAWALVSGPIDHRRFRRKFQTLGRELGQNVSSRAGWPMTFALTVDGRTFEIRHDYTTHTKNYRGPRGYLLITTTPLAASAWSMHQVDVAKSGWSAWSIGSKPSKTGDTAFDAQFVVLEDGLNVRDGWLDAPTRAAIAEFFDNVSVPGPLWIREGRVSYLMNRWKALDGQALRTVLEQQSALASALDRTAARRA
jgi:hypothetical protein